MLFNDPYGLDTIRSTVNNGRIQIPTNPNSDDVLEITNPDGSISYFNYDPNNPGANEHGYVGAGLESEEQEVVVTGKKSKPIDVNALLFDTWLAGAEYQVGKSLDKYRLDGYGSGRPLLPGPGQRVFDRSFPKGSYGRSRPVNIHIPGTGHSIQAPRYIVSATGRILKFAGVATAGASAISTELQYRNGEISNAHRWSNHVMIHCNL